MESADDVMARWERACERFLESEGAYTEGERREMWFLCETLAKVLGLPNGASAEKVKDLERRREEEEKQLLE